jgi:serine/threonine-protein kinase
MLDPLEYAHAEGFVHRDIKPSNLLVTRIEGQECAKLSDFGLARVYQASKLSGLTLMGNKAGTYPFIAPEQITNFREAKPPADLYSAGATLYNLLTARYVFDGPPQRNKWLLMVLQDEPVPIQARQAGISRELADLIHRALAKNPEKRFESAGAMRKALLPFCS